MSYNYNRSIPNDEQISKLGFRAFAPKREPFAPKASDFKRALNDVATGDPEELEDLANELYELFPNAGYHPMMFWGGYQDSYVDDDDM